MLEFKRKDQEIRKEAMFFNCAHFVESLQVFLVFMMLVNVV